MKIQLEDPKAKSVEIGDKTYQARMASVLEYNNYQKKVIKDPAKSAELMVEFLSVVGLPEDILWKMTFENLQQLISYYTLGDINQGK